MNFLKRHEMYLRLLAFTIMVTALLSLYASSNTLLHHGYTYDHTIFKIIGEAWADGQLPYKDIFDQKGPLPYLMQIIASVIPVPKLGTWILEIIWVVAACEMLFRCGKYIDASKRLSYISVGAVLIYYARYVDGGNTVEIWSLPFEILPLLLVLRYLLTHDRLGLTAFISGICLGIVSMIRLNNNAIIAGLIIGMAVYSCKKRDFRQLARCAGLFLSGFLVVIIPFILYFLSAGVLDDMIYCILTLSIHYMSSFGEVSDTTIFNNVIKLWPCVMFLVSLAFYGVKKGPLLPTFLILPPVITFLTIYSGLGFNHYFLMEIPFVALGIQLACPYGRYFKTGIIFSYLFLSIWNLKTHTFVRINELKERLANEAASTGAVGQRFVSEYIPDSDKTSVYVFGSIQPARALNENGYLPVGKYFFQQESYHLLDQRVHDDIIRKFIEANPKWIIAESGDMEPLTEYMGNYREVPHDSLPDTCPSYWHIYERRQ